MLSKNFVFQIKKIQNLNKCHGNLWKLNVLPKKPVLPLVSNETHHTELSPLTAWTYVSSTIKIFSLKFILYVHTILSFILVAFPVSWICSTVDDKIKNVKVDFKNVVTFWSKLFYSDKNCCDVFYNIMQNLLGYFALIIIFKSLNGTVQRENLETCQWN